MLKSIYNNLWCSPKHLFVMHILLFLVCHSVRFLLLIIFATILCVQWRTWVQCVLELPLDTCVVDGKCWVKNISSNLYSTVSSNAYDIRYCGFWDILWNYRNFYTILEKELSTFPWVIYIHVWIAYFLSLQRERQ